MTLKQRLLSTLIHMLEVSFALAIGYAAVRLMGWEIPSEYVALFFAFAFKFFRTADHRLDYVNDK